jgi:transcriptional antiterminator RfaH
VFPPDLLTGPAGDRPGLWWVLHTRPRAEKALVRKFLARDCAFYLPLYHKQWRKRGRLFATDVPLFPGYVFLHGDEQARLYALETNTLVRCLAVADQAQLHADLARVQHLIAAGSALTPEDRLQPGTAVEIVHGPLMGLRGKVLRRGKKMKFFVEVHFLQQGVSVEIESWMIQPLA